MKPQLLLADFKTGGLNNGDPGKTRSRLEKSASWKKQRIVVLLPTASMISAKVALAHWNLIFPPNNGVARILAVGMEVGEAYSQAIESVLAHPELGQWEYILTVESDNAPPPDGVLKLLERMEENPKLSCIGGLYFTKGYGSDGMGAGVPQIWGDPRDSQINFRPQMPDLNGGLVECNGTGMGFNLWRMSMFRDKKLRRPWFVTQKKDGVATQDLYFATDARKHGYRFAVDCSIKVGHYDAQLDVMF
jgi:hypothetical protein